MAELVSDLAGRLAGIVEDRRGRLPERVRCDPCHGLRRDRRGSRSGNLDDRRPAIRVDLEQTVLIGDQISDVKASLAAGALSIGYANKPGKSSDLATAGADAVVEDTNQLAAAVIEGA